MDSTTCPSRGVVRLVVPPYGPPHGEIPGGGLVDPNVTHSDNEVLGSHILLSGMRPQYRFFEDTDYVNAVFRGFSVHHAINGDSPVEPMGIGLLTWDLPTWVAIGSVLAETSEYLGRIILSPGGLFHFGAAVTVFDDWKAVSVSGDYIHHYRILRKNTGCLYVLAGNPENGLAYVGGGVTYSSDKNQVIVETRAAQDNAS
jgi:hypothetical protein